MRKKRPSKRLAAQTIEKGPKSGPFFCCLILFMVCRRGRGPAKSRLGKNVMKLRIVLLTLFLSACGPGVSDGDTPLTNGYVFSERGGLEKVIEYHGADEKAGAYLDATVVAYEVRSPYIAALRQPRALKVKNQTPYSWLEQKCEYWIINSENHEMSGPFDRGGFMEAGRPLGFTDSSLKTPVSYKVSHYCFG